MIHTEKRYIVITPSGNPLTYARTKVKSASIRLYSSPGKASCVLPSRYKCNDDGRLERIIATGWRIAEATLTWDDGQDAADSGQ